MNDYILVDILDNLDAELIESVNIEKDIKKDLRKKEGFFKYYIGHVFGLNFLINKLFGPRKFYIDNFEIEEAIEREKREEIEIKAFGRVVSNNEISNNKVSVKKRKIIETKAFKMITTIASVCIGIVGILTVVIKVKHRTRTA